MAPGYLGEGFHASHQPSDASTPMSLFKCLPSVLWHYWLFVSKVIVPAKEPTSTTDKCFSRVTCREPSQIHGKGSGKVDHAPQERVGGCSFPSPRPWAHRCRTTDICDAWPVRRQTYSYLPSCKASPLIGWYQIILLGDRGTCVLTTSTRQRGGWDSNPWCIDCKSSTLPPSHTGPWWPWKKSVS